MITAVNHITLAVSDLPRSFTFYTQLLGLTPKARWADGAYLLAGEIWICLSLDTQTRTRPLPEYSHLAFSVDAEDFRLAAAKLEQAGVGRWKKNSSEGDSVYFLDPDGHKLELHVGTLASRLQALQARPYQDLQLY